MIFYCISKYESTILGRPEKIEELTRELEQEKIKQDYPIIDQSKIR